MKLNEIVLIFRFCRHILAAPLWESLYVIPTITNLTYRKNNYYDDPAGPVRGAMAGYFLCKTVIDRKSYN
ncbi:MAG TPA: hypothetical protein VJ729_14540 [Nitrososphaeraceae archaeon]|nr:hypothetical protein [Nitrososphaeraceae archaeon]